jgi:uncharacterized protein YybS (DUF2232 family)
LEILAGLLVELVTAFLILGMASLAVYWALLKGLKPAGAATLGGAVVVVYLIGSFTAGQMGPHPDTFASLQQSFDQVWQLKAKSMADQKMSPADIELVRKLCEKYVLWSIPAWMLVGALGAGFVAYYLVSSVVSRSNPRVLPPLPFWQWTVPEPLVFGLIAALLIKVLAPENHWSDIVADNLVVFFSVLYTFAGMTIVSYYFQRWRFPGMVRILGYVAILMLTYNSICLLGVLDIWLDFRKLKRPPLENAT